jgi:hypothetical protein
MLLRKINKDLNDTKNQLIANKFRPLINDKAHTNSLTNNSTISQKMWFTLCESCLWCATLYLNTIDKRGIFSKCPVCQDNRIKFILVSHKDHDPRQELVRL